MGCPCLNQNPHQNLSAYFSWRLDGFLSLVEVEVRLQGMAYLSWGRVESLLLALDHELGSGEDGSQGLSRSLGGEEKRHSM